MGRPKAPDLHQPSAKWYRKWSPTAWLSDPDLRLCSLAAKGLWIEMLNLMMISPRPGFLLNQNRKPVPVEDLSKLTHEPVENIQKLLNELRERKVFSVDRRGVIFNRRTKKEEELHQTGVKTGKKSVENRERNQDGTLKPWTDPGTRNPGIVRVRVIDRYTKRGIGNLTSPTAGRTRGDLEPSERKARWQTKVIAEARATMPDTEFTRWLEAFGNNEAWAKAKAEQIDKILKSAKRNPETVT